MRLVVYSLLLLLVTMIAPTCVASRNDDDGALYLTPMIQAGKIKEARDASRMKPLKANVESYSGYLTVDETHGSNMFFWFFPAMNGAADAPVLLWLQGGPGVSSLYAVFDEHGPFSVGKTHGLKLRNHTWTATHSMLYVDNPVGTGFSFTGDDGGYSRNQTAVGLNLYEALVQFFTVFADYRNNDFYVTGESYAGKYVPAVAHAIHTNNPKAQVKINFKGLAIGNGLVDPINQLVYSEYLYQHGLLDEDGKREMAQLECLARSLILGNNFTGAFKTFDKLLLNLIDPYPSLFTNLTGMQYNYNFLWDRDPAMFGNWEKYVQQPTIRSALHVGQRPFNNGSAVARHLLNDVMRSVSPWLADLLEAGQYRVLLYSGQLDIIVPYQGTMQMVQFLQWSGAEKFKKATRTIWHVQLADNTTNVAGYVTTSGPLTVVLVRDAGHMVPADQPVWGLDLINRFTSAKPF